MGDSESHPSLPEHHIVSQPPINTFKHFKTFYTSNYYLVENQ